MKLPLKWGFLALLGLWVLHAFLEEPNARTILLVLAMAVALWTAFSLNIPPRREPEEEEAWLEPPEEGREENEDGATRDSRDGDPTDCKRPPR